MYQALLTRKYLTSKIMPLLACCAVALCVGLVLTVWSVMGGFLNTLLGSGRALVGDVEIVWPNVGIAHYEELIKRLEADQKMVTAAAPVIDTFGVVTLPDDRVEGVQIKGIEPVAFARITDFESNLWWRPTDQPLRRDYKSEDPRLIKSDRAALETALRDGLSMSKPEPNTPPGVEPKRLDAAVPGIEMLGLSRRTAGGYYELGAMGRATTGGVEMVGDWALRRSITLHVLPMSEKGRPIVSDIKSITLPVANEMRTGVYEFDKRSVLVPLERLQRELLMHAGKRYEQAVDPYERRPEVKMVDDPARVTTIVIKAAPGVTPDQVRDYAEKVYRAFATEYAGQVPPAGTLIGNNLIRTWKMKQAGFVAAVEKETALVLFLFAIISAVVSLLILAIFWSMINEKTKDIGILRAIGASRSGIVWLWVRYGLVIGVVGAIAGGLMAYGIVTNINPIHEWMGARMGIQIWDPKVYYFSEIPNKVDPMRAAIVMLAGVGFSLLGAIIPAYRAGRMDPVKALRFE